MPLFASHVKSSDSGNSSAASKITVGDLHGNPEKLLLLYVEAGILRMNAETLQDLKACFAKTDPRSLELIKEFSDTAKVDFIKIIRLLEELLSEPRMGVEAHSVFSSAGSK